MEASDIIAGELVVEEMLARLREFGRRNASSEEKATWCIDYFVLGVMIQDHILLAQASENALANEAELFARNGVLKTLHPALHHYCFEEWHLMFMHPASRLKLFRHAITAVVRWTGAPVSDERVQEILKATTKLDGRRPIMLRPPRDRIWDRLRH